MLTLSMSMINTFLRCEKQFLYQYVHGLRDYVHTPKVALENGTAFHKYMEYHAKGKDMELDWDTEMGRVARTFLLHNPLPENIIAVEESHEFMLFDDVKITFTCDLVYKSAEHSITIRDWKTFSKYPSYDIDLDFQGRFYLWAAYKKWPELALASFEKVFCRSEEPLIDRGGKKKPWTLEECYPPTASLLLQKDELIEDEKQIVSSVELIKKLLETNGVYRRMPLSGGGYTDCAHCPTKEMCKQDASGNLNFDNLQDLVVEPTGRMNIYGRLCEH
jgi:hypothetical protein